MPKYSLIIPVYNRPEEVDELLTSLTLQTFKDFEVLVVEDGSSVTCSSLLKKFSTSLMVQYYFKENEGQGFARNYGYQRAKGDYFIVFDSDCIIPARYLEEVDVFLKEHKVDAFGGPDKSHPLFTPLQQSIGHTMTSFFTTGGIRGRNHHFGTFHPRSFNMGISRVVYEKTRGYLIPFMGEDLEFSIRIIKSGFKTALIEKAFVFHKRRTSLLKFYKQLYYFGRARINLTRFHEGQLKLLHLFPLLFTIGWVFSALIGMLNEQIATIGLGLYSGYLSVVVLEALWITKSLGVAIRVPITVITQMAGYGLGLMYEFTQKKRGINPNKKYIEIY